MPRRLISKQRLGVGNMKRDDVIHPSRVLHPNRRLSLACRRAGASLLLLGGLAVGTVAGAQQRQVPDTYTAVTANMSPAGVELKADVIHWSSAAERAAVVAALGAEDVPVALRALPTAGVIWRSGSAVGHSIKYAHRETGADGSETITLLTDRPIGASSFNAWVANDPADVALDYSVVEFTVPPDGDGGQGTMSFAAEVRIDGEASSLSLDAGTRAPLLQDTAREPKPYWAVDDSSGD